MTNHRFARSMLAALLAAGLLAGCGGGGDDPAPHGDAAAEAQSESESDSAPEAEAIPVEVTEVRQEPLSSVYATSSTLRAEKRATVIARTRGVIRRLAVEEGDSVAAGQALAFLEDDEQKITYERARTTWETRRREYERMQRLYEQKLVSDEQFETARREAEDSEHAANLAELELSRTVIQAPFAGLIVTRHLDVGATVADGTPVYDLADVRPLYADINVPEKQVARLQPGQPVRLIADSSDEQVAARIERVAPAVDPASGTVKVTAAVEGVGGLRPGAFVRVAVVTDTHPEALVVPRSALVAEGRRWLLYRLADDGAAEQLEVKIGFEEGDRVEIAEVVGDEQLRPGERVVVVGASALSDGARVKVMEPERAAAGDGGAQPAAAD